MSVTDQLSQTGYRQVAIAKEELSAVATAEYILPNEFDFVEVFLHNLRPATDNVALFLRVRDYGDTAIQSGATAYAWAYSSQLAGTGAVDASDASDSEIQLALASGNATSEGVSGRILIQNFADQAIAGTQQYTTVKFDLNAINATPGYVDYTGSGWRLSAERSDQFQLLFASGNIATGTVEVVGHRAI